MLEDLTTMKTYATPREIGAFIRSLRESFSLKQEALAADARIHVRTLIRVEAGEKTSDATLAQIAKAFKLPDNFFAEGIADLSAAIAAEAKAEFEQTHLLVNLARAGHAREVVDHIAGCDGMFHATSELNAAQVEAAQILFALADDWGQILDGLAVEERHSATESLGGQMQALTDAGLALHIGRAACKVRATGSAKGAPTATVLDWELAVLYAAPAGTEMPQVAIPKDRLRF